MGKSKKIKERNPKSIGRKKYLKEKIDRKHWDKELKKGIHKNYEDREEVNEEEQE